MEAADTPGNREIALDDARTNFKVALMGNALFVRLLGSGMYEPDDIRVIMGPSLRGGLRKPASSERGSK